MLFLQIPAKLLQSRKLSSDEKILLSFIASLNKQGRGFFGGSDYLARELGLQDPEGVLQSLGDDKRDLEGKIIRAKSIEFILGRWQLTPAVFNLLYG